MKKNNIITLAAVLMLIIGSYTVISSRRPKLTTWVTEDEVGVLDLDSNDIEIIDNEFVIENAYFGFTCSKCGSHELRFKPNPVTIKREVGAVVEVTGEWSCADCGYLIAE